MIHSQIDSLVQGVRDLAVQVEQNAQAMRIAQRHADQLSRSTRRQRVALMLTIIGLCADLVLSVLIVISYHRMACTQDSLQARQVYNERNFTAEYAKVSGQIKGVDQIRSDPAGGIDQFKAASQRYLDQITAIHKDQLAHPAGSC